MTIRLARLERAAQQWGIRVLTARLRTRVATTGSPTRYRLAHQHRPYRVLFLRHDRIGDMVVSTGVLNAIAQSHPGLELDVLTSPANAPVLTHAPYVSNVVLFNAAQPWTYPKVLWRLRRARYHAVIDCMVTAPSLTTLLLMAASGAHDRIGVTSRAATSPFTVPIVPRDGVVHMVDYLSALLTAFGVDANTVSYAPVLHFSPQEREHAERRWPDVAEGEDRPRRLLVNISAGTAVRRWPDDRFVIIIREVRRMDTSLQILLISGPEDSARATWIAQQAQIERTPTTSVREAFACVATADFVVTPDTSIGHAASACHTPAVVLFLHGKSAAWGPYQTDGIAIESPTLTLDDVPVERVLAALTKLLDGPANVLTAANRSSGGRVLV